MISTEILNRKGARKVDEIPLEVMRLLNSGQIATVNLVEWLGVDQLRVLRNFLDQVNCAISFHEMEHDVSNLKKQTVNTVNETIGLSLYNLIQNSQRDDIFELMSNHISDIVRGWAAYVIANEQNMIIDHQLKKMKKFAADEHFGVREIAWLSIRPNMVQELSRSIVLMEEWALSKDENVRRFASESLRPRGVWCAHIKELKENPDMAINILEPLKADPSKYVRDSVGNWINDASKTAPDWAEDLCTRWTLESSNKETAYIVKKGMRTILKNRK